MVNFFEQNLANLGKIWTKFSRNFQDLGKIKILHPQNIRSPMAKPSNLNEHFELSCTLSVQLFVKFAEK